MLSSPASQPQPFPGARPGGFRLTGWIHDLSGFVEPHLPVTAQIRHHRQVFQTGQVERPEKLLGSTVLPGPSRHLQTTAFFDHAPFQQQPHGIGTVHPPDLIHIGAGSRLIVGDDGQHLQRRLAQLAGLRISNALRITSA